MTRPKILIHPTPPFLRAVDALAEELGDSAEGILLEMGRAIQRLEKEGWGSSLPVEQVGGDTFRYDFHSEFAFEYRRETQRGEGKKPVQVDFYLLILLRR